MSLATRTRLPELDTLRERVDRLFSEFAVWPRDGFEKLAVPVDVQETEDTVTVTASMPGIKAEDIAVEVNNGILTIRGESREERDETQGAWHVQERRVGNVERTLTLPTGADPGSAAATVKDGVLTVTFTKATTESKKSIPVTAG